MRAPLALALLLLGAMAAAALAPAPEPVDYVDPVPAEVRERNAAARTALAMAGVTSAIAEHDAQRFLIAYEMPESGGALPPDDLQRFALAVAARLAPPDADAVARQQANGTLLREWRVPSADVMSYLAGDLSRETLEARIEKQESTWSADAAQR